MAAVARDQKYDHLFKILIIGDSAVGKSCLMCRYTEDCYSENFIATVGMLN